MSGFSRYAVALAAAAFSIAALTPAAFADIGDFIGSWNNADPSTAGITHVVIEHAGGGNAVRVHVFGRCHPSDCDWGTAMGHAYTDSVGSPEARSVVATFNSGFSTDQVILRRGPGHTLRMELYVAFTDGSGRNDYMMSGRLDPAIGWGGGPWPPLPPLPGGPAWGGGGPGGPGGGGIGTEDCISFNPATSDVAFVNGSWKYVDGSHWILDFGSNHGAAMEARHVINHYHLNAQCFVVRPNAAMAYWKSGGGIPMGSMGGSDCIPVNTAAVQAQFAGGAWKVVDTSNGSWLLDFGGNHASADKAAATIHYYGMNRQCFVGRTPGPPGMQYWLAH